MRLGLAPLAAAIGVTGAISVGAAVTQSHPRVDHDPVVMAEAAQPSSAPAPAPSDAVQPVVVVKHAPRVPAPNVVPPLALPSCPGGPSVHFETPEAAMRYLASAWNRNDLAELCQVTNPNARLLLLDMHRQALNLRLQKCTYVEVGHYGCTFTHDYPPRLHMHGVGHAYMDVAAADKPGWYMTVYEGCG